MNVLNVPNAYKIIILISSLTRKNYKFHFNNDVCNIYYGIEMVGIGHLIQGLYYGNNISNNKKPQTNVSNDNAML